MTTTVSSPSKPPHCGRESCAQASQVPRSLDQLQLDFVGLGWAKEHVEEQHRQYTEKLRFEATRQQALERTPSANHPPGVPAPPAGSKPASAARAAPCEEVENDPSCSAVPESSSAGPHKRVSSPREEVEQACITEEKLQAAWQAARSSLGLSDGLGAKLGAASKKGAVGRVVAGPLQTGRHVNSARPGLLAEIRASLFVRRRGEGENVSVKGEKRKPSELPQAEPRQTRTPLPNIAPMRESFSNSEPCPACNGLSGEKEGGDSCVCNGAGEKLDRTVEKDGKLLRTVWLVSRGVERVLCGLGRSRYKVISAGCVAFQARNASKYRLSYGGAQWLVPLALDICREEVLPEEGLGEKEQQCNQATVSCDCICDWAVRHSGKGDPVKPRAEERSPCPLIPRPQPQVLLRVGPDIMLELLGDGTKPPRIDMKRLCHLPGGQKLQQTTEEGPLVLVTNVERSRKRHVGHGERAGPSEPGRASAHRPSLVIVRTLVSRQVYAKRGRPLPVSRGTDTRGKRLTPPSGMHSSLVSTTPRSDQNLDVCLDTHRAALLVRLAVPSVRSPRGSTPGAVW